MNLTQMLIEKTQAEEQAKAAVALAKFPLDFAISCIERNPYTKEHFNLTRQMRLTVECQGLGTLLRYRAGNENVMIDRPVKFSEAEAKEIIDELKKTGANFSPTAKQLNG